MNEADGVTSILEIDKCGCITLSRNRDNGEARNTYMTNASNVKISSIKERNRTICNKFKLIITDLPPIYTRGHLHPWKFKTPVFIIY